MKARVILGTALLRAWGATWRVSWDGLENLAAARRESPRGNVILAFWHGMLLVLAYSHRRRDIQVLVSQHRDGEWIAQILARMGLGLARGSSRRGGTEALFRLATQLAAGDDIALTVDGPQGPRYRVHPGAVLLARRTGQPIVPLCAAFEHGTFLGTWDALRLPRPGTRLRVYYGEPIFVPAGAGAEPPAAYDERLRIALGALTQRAEADQGRRLELFDVRDKRSYWERASENPRPPALLRGLAAVHAAGRAAERRLRPRPHGRGEAWWVLGLGNLEAGGTGKTPCTVEIAGALARRGIRTAILTRGHGGALGRTPERVTPENLDRASDETRFLAAALGPQVPVWVARDKRAGWEVVRRQGGAGVLVVDDAFQTAGLPVDRHIVLLDARTPFANGFVLPAGRLREGAAALRRADAVIFTRAGAVDGVPAGAAWSHVAAGRLTVAREVPAGLSTMRGTAVDLETLRGKGVACISGLGRPQAFEALLGEFAAAHGFEVHVTVRIGDHAPLEPELRKLAGRLAALGCAAVVTTAKDAARLPSGSKWDEPLLVLGQRLVIANLDAFLDELLPAAYSASAKFANTTDNDALT